MILSLNLYRPTPLQRQIHESGAKFRIINAGRRFGKNIFALNDLLIEGFKQKDQIIYWTAPIYKQAKRDFRRFLKWFPESFKKKWSTELRIELLNETILEFHGVDNPDGILGEGLNHLYIDEAARIGNNTFYETLLPMLVDNKDTRLTAFSTPKGKLSWFFKYFTEGQNKENWARIKSWQFKSVDNPYVDRVEIANYRKEIPERIFRQEFEAEFLEDDAKVFSGFHSCIDHDIDNSVDKYERYRIGVDIAKTVDYTVFAVLNIRTGQLVDFHRFNGVDYVFMVDKLKSLSDKWNRAEIIIDSTMNESVYDMLVRKGCSATPYRFTNQSKINLIENLAIKIQNREISFPAIPELIRELEIFECVQTPNSVKYSAPSGYHDDCVIGLALACWGHGGVVDYKFSLNQVYSAYESVGV